MGRSANRKEKNRAFSKLSVEFGFKHNITSAINIKIYSLTQHSHIIIEAIHRKSVEGAEGFSSSATKHF